MVVKNIIAEDMPFTKSIFEQFWRSYCKKTIFVVFHFLKFLPYYIKVGHADLNQFLRNGPKVTGGISSAPLQVHFISWMR